MAMLFLGTGAAELIPNPFCSCEHCEYARKHPEERRRRSSFQYDDATMLDFGPDTIDACLQYNVSLVGLRDILYTHLHDDHFSIANMNVSTMCTIRPAEPFTVHVSQIGYEYLCKVRQAILAATNGYNDLMQPVERGFYTYQAHKPFETFTIGNKSVFTVRGTHRAEAENERSQHYRITENGKTFLYALDGSVYEDESLEALSGTPVDILCMDATFGSVDVPESSGHLCGRTFLIQLEKLAKAGVVTDSTRVYATHINQKNVWTHEAYQKFFVDAGAGNVTVAHDGMEIHW